MLAHLPAVVVGSCLAAAVVFLVGVSMFVPAPDPSTAPRGEDIVTAVQPSAMDSAGIR